MNSYCVLRIEYRVKKIEIRRQNSGARSQNEKTEMSLRGEVMVISLGLLRSFYSLAMTKQEILTI